MYFFREIMRIDRAFFRRHQRALLAIANSLIGRWYFHITEHPMQRKFTRIEPFALHWEHDGKMVAEFRTSNCYANRIKHSVRWIMPIIQGAAYYGARKLAADTAFLLSMPLVFGTTTDFLSGSGNGLIASGESSWATSHAASSGGTPETTAIYAGCYKQESGLYNIYRGFTPFDTSSLGSAEITAAEVSLWVYTVNNQDNDGDDWVNVVQATVADPTSLASGDYDQIGAVTNPTEGSTRKDLSSIGTGAFKTWTLNATGLTWINPSGWTQLGWREGHDAIDSAITGPGGSVTQNRMAAYSASETGKEPKLTVTYTPAPTSHSINESLRYAVSKAHSVTKSLRYAVESKQKALTIPKNFGKTDIGASNWLTPNGTEARVTKFTGPSVDAMITAIAVYAYTDSGTAPIAVAVYEDSSGTPGAKLAEDDGNGTATTTPQFIIVPLSLRIEAGKTYWLACFSGVGAQVNLKYDTGSTNQSNYADGLTFENWPSTWPAGTFQNRRFSIYAIAYQRDVGTQLKYAIRRAASAVTKSLRYTNTIVQAIAKSIRYAVAVGHDITKSGKYAVTSGQSSTKSLAYKVETQTAVTKSLKYCVLTEAPVTKQLVYAVVVETPITKNLTYLVETQAADTKSLKYEVQTDTKVMKSLAYCVLTDASTTKSLGYHVATEHPITKSLRYEVRRPWEQLVDNFDADTLDAHWTQTSFPGAGPITLDNNELNIETEDAGAQYTSNGMYSTEFLDLRDSVASIEIVDLGPMLTGDENYIAWPIYAVSEDQFFNVEFDISCQGGVVYFNGAYYYDNGVDPADFDGDFMVWDPAIRFVRIRSSGSIVYWEYSTDGTNWTILFQKDVTVFMDSMASWSVGPFADQFDTGAGSTRTVVYDNWNVAVVEGTVQKSLAYAVVTSGTVQKNLTYAVKTQGAVTKSLQYVVQTTGEVGIQKALVYAVVTDASVTLSSRYAVAVETPITKSSKYAVITEQAASKSLKYTIETASPMTLSLKYEVAIEGVMMKSLRYEVLTTGAVTKSLRYAVAVEGVITKGAKYSVRSPESSTKGLIYKIVASVALAKNLTYQVVAGATSGRSLKYAVLTSNAIQLSLTYVRKLGGKVELSLRYEIAQETRITKSLRYVMRHNPYTPKPGPGPYTPKVPSPFTKKNQPYTPLPPLV